MHQIPKYIVQTHADTIPDLHVLHQIPQYAVHADMTPDYYTMHRIPQYSVYLTPCILHLTPYTIQLMHYTRRILLFLTEGLIKCLFKKNVTDLVKDANLIVTFNCQVESLDLESRKRKYSYFPFNSFIEVTKLLRGAKGRSLSD